MPEPKLITNRTEAYLEYKAYVLQIEYSVVDVLNFALDRYIQKEKAWKKMKYGRSYSTATRPRSYSTATTQKVSHETMIREELLSLPEFKPIFISFVTFIQVIVFAAMIFQSLTQNQFAKWGLDTRGQICSDDCPLSANSSLLTGTVKTEPVNPVSAHITRVVQTIY